MPAKLIYFVRKLPISMKKVLFMQQSKCLLFFLLFFQLVFFCNCSPNSNKEVLKTEKRGTVSEQNNFVKIDYNAWNIHKQQLDDTLKQCTNDWQKTTILREFVAHHADSGAGTPDVDELYAEWYNFSVPTFFTLFDQDKASAKCGVTSHVLQKLYEMYDYKAVSYDMGKPNSELSHVTTLVEITHKGKKQFIVQDAMFNYAMTDTSGKPKDFYTLLEELQYRNTTNIQITHSEKPIYKESLLNYNIDLPAFLEQKKACKNRIAKITTATDSTQAHKILFKLDLDVMFDCNTNGAAFLNMLKENGFEKDFSYIHLLPIQVNGDSSTYIQTKIDSILSLPQ